MINNDIFNSTHMVSDKQLIYVASPYSHPDKLVQRKRFIQAQQLCEKLIKEGKIPFSPIVYTHEISKQYGLPEDAHYWKRFNEAFMERSNVLYFCLFDGWKTSIGMKMELEFAESLGLSIHYYKPTVE